MRDKHLDALDKLSKKWPGINQEIMEQKTKSQLLELLLGGFKKYPLYVSFFLEYTYEFDKELEDEELRKYVIRFLEEPEISEKVFWYLEENEKIRDLFFDDILEKYFSSLIKYYSELDFSSFYHYEICIEVLCRYFKYFDKLFNLEDKYIERLFYSIKWSGDGDHGYAFNGLRKLENNIHYLNRNLILKLLWKFEDSMLTNITVKQIISLIWFFRNDSTTYKKIKYFFIDRRVLEEDITWSIAETIKKINKDDENLITSLDNTLMSRTFNIINDTIICKKDMLKLQHKIEEEQFFIEFFILYQEDYSSTYKVIKTQGEKRSELLTIKQIFPHDDIIKVKLAKSLTYINQKTISYSFYETGKLTQDYKYKDNLQLIDEYIEIELNNKEKYINGKIYQTYNEDELHLVYLWIKEYKGIFENEEFNFSNEYEFTFKDNYLDYKKTSDRHPENFYYINSKYFTKLRNVTAIVGKNGSGKSSLLRFILDNFNYVDVEKISSFIIVFKKGNEFHMFSLGKFSELQFNKERIVDKSSELMKHSNKIELSVVPYLLNNFHIVHFSNIFSFNKEESRYNVVDPENVYLDISSEAIYKNENKVKDSEIVRQVSFLFSEYKDLILNKFKFKNIYLQIDFNDPITEFQKKTESKLFKDVERLIKVLEQEFKTEGILDLTLYIIKLSLLEFTEIYTRHGKEYSIFLQLVNTVRDEAENNNSYDFIKHFYEILEKEYERILLEKNDDFVKVLPDEYKVQCSNRKQLIEIFQANFQNSDTTSNMSIALEQNLIEEVIQKYQESKFNTNIISFTLPNLSSGQEAMLLTYSRFYWLFMKDNKNTKISIDYQLPSLKNNLIILIDEGETLFHPEWQREYLYNLIHFIERVTKNNKDINNIQIIMTSNSPFILSDLPKENIILMENDEGKCKRVTDINQKTFGSNIHTLFANNFFLKDKGVMGEFAKQKIGNVIKALNNNSKEKLTENELIYIINSIGEPIISGKLQEMLLLSDYINTDKKIEDIDKEIERLQKVKENILKGKRNND